MIGTHGPPCGPVERFINRLKQHRRVATRYDKAPESYLGFVLVASLLTLLA